MIHGLRGHSAIQTLLDGKRNRRSIGLRTAFDNFLKQRLQWSTVCGGKKDEAVPEPMVEYQGRFGDFCREILNVEPWSKQEEIAQSVEDHPKTTVSACYASGKTFIAACLVLYRLFTRRPCLVVTTAPTGRQVKGVLWREIRKIYKRCHRALKGRLLQTKLEFSDDWQGFGFSSDGANAVAGLHEAENVFFVVDEAAGIDQETFDGFDGITTGSDSRVLLIGNPICVNGPFFDSHMHPVKKLKYHQINIRAIETPNVLAGKPIIKGLVEKEWVEEKRVLWGENSPAWKTKCLGEFVTVSLDKIVPEAWVEDAHKRWLAKGFKPGQRPVLDPAIYGPKIMGIDVAGGGKDESVMYIRQGDVLFRIFSTAEGDHDLLFKKIVAIVYAEKIERIYIDATQISKGLADRLAAIAGEDEFGQDCGLNKCIVTRVYFNESADDKDLFENRPSEIAFLMRAWFDPTHPTPVACDPGETVLTTQLSDRIWILNDKNKIQVESKSQMAKRGVGSPDHADGANLTFLRSGMLAA
jgi:phage terminase large subunit